MSAPFAQPELGSSLVTAASSSSFVRRAAVAALFVAFCAAGAAKAQTPPQPDRTVDMAAVLQPGPLPELSIGDAGAVPVVEYGSLTCSHCATFAVQVLPQFTKDYVDAGKVRFIFREFARNPLDAAAFVLARCVGDDKALATIDLLFAEQDKWAFVNNPLDALIGALRPTGMTHDRAIACLKDQAKADAMSKIVQTAEATVKINGTPTFVINGKVYEGELTLDQLKAILQPPAK
jgi:protein-disulfide isomerase